MGRRVGMLLCLAALTLPGTAWSQVPSPSADREAREHFEHGRDAFSQGDYATAATQFEQAYALSRRSALLYNIGTSYERLHRWAEASQAFQRYINENPMAPDRPEVEARLRMITVELTHPVTIPTVSPVVSPVTTPTVSPVVTPTPAYDAPRPWRTVFWATGLAGVVVGAVTLTLGVVTNQRYNSLLTNCAPNCPAIDVDDMRQRQTFINLGIAGTSILAAGAVTAFVLDYLQVHHAAGSTPRAALVPVSHGAMLSFEGSL